MKYPCACCGHYTLDNNDYKSYDICPVCFWEDDPIQNQMEDTTGCANSISLKEAKKNYILFGAIKKTYLNLVRKPFESELSINNTDKQKEG